MGYFIALTNAFPFLSIFLQPTHLADFHQVQTIQYSTSEDKDRKGVLQMKIAGAPEASSLLLSFLLNHQTVSFTSL